LGEVLQHTTVKASLTLFEVGVELFRSDIQILFERPNKLQKIFIEGCIHVVLLELSRFLELV
jgi:hypothetical protein